MDEIVAYEEERFVLLTGQRVGEAVTEVEPCLAAASSPIAFVGVSGNSSPMLGHWLDVNFVS